MTSRDFSSSVSSRPPFVGREKELAFLAECLVRAAQNDGAVVLLSGEAGIGKTRLLSELSARAQQGGWLVLSGRSYDTEGMPPYLAFAEAITQYLTRSPDDEAGARLAAAAHEVALLVPELRDRLPDTSRPSLGPAADRYRLFEGVSDFFLRLSSTSEAGGLLLCLDDLHWADRSTLLLFQHLARKVGDSRVLVVGAYRPEEVDAAHPLFDVLAELARDQQQGWRLALARLSSQETSALIASFSSLKPAPALVEAIQGQTEGNPFFVQEVVRQLQSQDSGLAGAEPRSEAWGLSEGVRQVIGRRLARFGAETRRRLDTAAVLGDGFDAALLGAATGSDAATVTRALEELAPAGILRELESSYAFGHPLTRQVVYEGLGLARRQELHLRAAQAIESLHAASIERHLSALAAHYRLAGAAGLTKATDYAMRAGDRAAAVFAFDEALRLYDLALTDLEMDGLAQDAEAAELQVQRGNALAGLGRWAESRAAFEAAAAGFSRERRADVLLILANAGTSGPPDVASGRRHAALALELAVELRRPDLEAAATALLAQSDQAEGKFKSALVQYERAYAQAKGLRPAPQFQMFHHFPLGLYYAGRLEEAVGIGMETVASALAAHNGPVTVVAYGNLGLALTSSGRYSEAQLAFVQARQTTRDYPVARMQTVLPRVVGMSASLSIEALDLSGAATIAEEARDLGRSASRLLPIVSAGLDLIAIAVRRRELAGVDDLVTEVTENLDRGGGAHALLWRSRLDSARAELALARTDWRQALDLADSAVEMARGLGRPKYEALGLTSRGKALVGLGRKREGMSDLRQAVEVARPVGDPSMFLRAAVALLAVEGDDTLAADARAATERMLANLPDKMKAGFGAAEPVQLVYRLTGARPSDLPSRPAYPDGLTAREVEVLRLIARGKSSREIGEELVLSVRTVERHIANIYLKTDTHGRAQVTTYALNKGLN